MRGWAPFVVVAALLGGLAAGCGADSGSEPGEGRRTVVAAFYPLAWAAERVAGPGVHVVDLTPPGAEPHDLELSAGDLETIRDAELVVYLGGGFQPAIEDAVTQRQGPSLDLLHGERDPHVWLDPVRFARALAEIAQAVDAADSARPVLRRLRRLHVDYRRGLSECERRVLVTTHAAFGRLAARYGLEQLALSGSSPESEPGPRELERLIERVRASGATTVFAEPLVSDRVAQTVARETGSEVATLDPLEGLDEERLAAGEDYVSVMRSNLAALREALGCR